MLPRADLCLNDDPHARRPGVEDVVVYALVPLLLTLLDPPRGAASAWLRALAINALVGGCIAGTVQLTYALFWPRVLRRPPGRIGQIAAHLGTVLAGVFVGGELATPLCVLIWHDVTTRIRPNIHRIGAVVSLVMVTLLLVYERLKTRARASEAEANAARLAAVRAQLGALVARTNPHFLFNSLNSVAALIPEDAARAEAMLERLATLFRYALEGAQRREVRLCEELAIVRDYLEIEAIRLGERLDAAVHVGDDLDDALVPPLSLQALVENAIVHGVAPRRGRGRVEVSAVRLDGRLELTVDDDGPGTSGTGGTHSALADLRARLALLHGDAATLVAGPRPGGGWRARVSLPLRTAREPA